MFIISRITPRKSDVIPAHIDATHGGATTDEVSRNDDGLTLMHRGVRRSLTFRAVRGAPCHCGKRKLGETGIMKRDGMTGEERKKFVTAYFLI